MVKFARKLLEDVAKQMNSVMGLDPAIDVNASDDDTLLDTIVWEARGRDVVKDAIRRDDFVTSNPDKKTFDDDSLKFFVAAGVWDAPNKVAVMAGKAVETPVDEKPAKIDKKKEPKQTKPVEQDEQDNMDAGESELELPLEAKPETKTEKKDTMKTTKAAVTSTRGTVSRKTAVAKKRAAKAASKNAVKPAAEKKEAVEKTKLGSRVGSQAGVIDELLLAGATRDDIAKRLHKDFKMDAKKASSRLSMHLQYLKALKVAIAENEKTGVIKANTK